MMASAYEIREFPGATFTGVPGRCELGREQVFAFLSRAPGNGPIVILSFIGGGGRDVVPPIDLRKCISDIEDAFGASPFVSNYDKRLKAAINYKPRDGGNNRTLAIVDTAITPQEEV